MLRSHLSVRAILLPKKLLVPNFFTYFLFRSSPPSPRAARRLSTVLPIRYGEKKINKNKNFSPRCRIIRYQYRITVDMYMNLACQDGVGLLLGRYRDVCGEINDSILKSVLGFHTAWKTTLYTLSRLSFPVASAVASAAAAAAADRRSFPVAVFSSPCPRSHPRAAALTTAPRRVSAPPSAPRKRSRACATERDLEKCLQFIVGGRDRGEVWGGEGNKGERKPTRAAQRPPSPPPRARCLIGYL